MKLSFYKVFLWIVSVTLIAAMFYALFLTHPIKNFDNTVFLYWTLLTALLIPATFFINREALKRFSVVNANVPQSQNKKKRIFDPEILLSAEGGVIFIIIVAAVSSVLLTGLVISVLLLPIEIIITLLLENNENKSTFPIVITRGICVAYASYFIVLALINYF